MDQIQLEINNWDTYQPRKELKSLRWIRIESGVFDGELFFYLSPNQRLLFFYLLTYAGKKNSNKLVIRPDFVANKLGQTSKEVLSGVLKLQEHSILTVFVTNSSRISTDQCTTNDTNITNEHNDTNTYVPVKEVVDLWNSFQELPKVERLTKPRSEKLKTRLTEPAFDFKKIIPLVAASDFLTGKTKDSNWRANFDWLIKNESNYIKVLEGNYKNKGAGKNVFSTAKDQIAKIQRGEL